MSKIIVLLIGLLFISFQITLLNLFSIRGVKPDLVVLFVVARAVVEGPTAGVAWGFTLGFILDALSGGLAGMGALAYSLAGFISGQIGLGKSPTRVRYMIVLALGTAASFAVFFYFLQPWNRTGWLQPLLSDTVPSMFYTWCLGSIWILSPFTHLSAGKKHG